MHTSVTVLGLLERCPYHYRVVPPIDAAAQLRSPLQGTLRGNCLQKLTHSYQQTPSANKSSTPLTHSLTTIFTGCLHAPCHRDRMQVYVTCHTHCIGTACEPSISHTGLSRAEFISVVRIPLTNVRVSLTTPWT